MRWNRSKFVLFAILLGSANVSNATNFKALCYTRSGNQNGMLNKPYYFGLAFSTTSNGSIASYRFLGDISPELTVFKGVCAIPDVRCNVRFSQGKTFQIILPYERGILMISNDGYSASTWDDDKKSYLTGVGECGLREGTMTALPEGFGQNKN